MKEEGILQVKWIKTEDSTSDVSMKNLCEALFINHSRASVVFQKEPNMLISG